MAELRSLVVVLGDQLDLDAAAFDGFDPKLDAVWMAEVAEESTHVWSSKQRTALFLSAMRHFARSIQEAGRDLNYTRLDASHNALGAQLQADLLRLRPAQLVMTAPGDWRALQAIRFVAAASAIPLDVRVDRHFYTTVREFAMHAKGRKSLRMEYFYREQRKRHKVLMDDGDASDEPLGGRWNFDSLNRKSFGAEGPGSVPPRVFFQPDAITREVILLVNTRFAEHPGRLDNFGWPVTRAQALESLRVFIEDRLPLFGPYQDALWPNEPWLYHAHISSALNLKLLNPREVVAAAELAYQSRRAPLASVEGFIRQILGWREYVRGIYWTQMPGYAGRNLLDARQDLPAWYWTGATDLACLRDVLAQTLTHGYANHIQRLMVTGLYALMLGVQPQQMHAWYLAVYVDAVEWVELPNTLGMSQYADDGLMGSKPYVATGKYIERMSPHCKNCRYDPGQKAGDRACPFTTLYWDFLMRHQVMLAKNPRMVLQVKNLTRLSEPEKQAVRERAAAIRRAEIGPVQEA
jgi:deoxyribodipyrimidine photolyase-related protein